MRRFRIRTIMLGVALLAILMSAYFHRDEWRQRRLSAISRARLYRDNAQSSARLEEALLKEVAKGQSTTFTVYSLQQQQPQQWTLPLTVPDLKRLAAEAGQLRRKYEYAASHPWYAAAPDPEPEYLKLAREKGVRPTPWDGNLPTTPSDGQTQGASHGSPGRNDGRGR